MLDPYTQEDKDDSLRLQQPLHPPIPMTPRCLAFDCESRLLHPPTHSHAQSQDRQHPQPPQYQHHHDLPPQTLYYPYCSNNDEDPQDYDSEYARQQHQQQQQQQQAHAQPYNNEQQQPFQGVLWKRRDVFTRSWRPRWFVLQPGQGVLTYYLLLNVNQTQTMTTTPMLQPRQSSNTAMTTSTMTGTTTATTTTTTIPSNGTAGSHHSLQSPLPQQQQQQQQDHRSRATSWDSLLSFRSDPSNHPPVIRHHTIDYDVVPRGTLYLLGCTVECYTETQDASISSFMHHNNNHKLFGLVIVPPTRTEKPIHLAAPSAALRNTWCDQIAMAADAVYSTTSTRRIPSYSPPPSTPPHYGPTTAVPTVPVPATTTTPPRSKSSTRPPLAPRSVPLPLPLPLPLTLSSPTSSSPSPSSSSSSSNPLPSNHHLFPSSPTPTAVTPAATSDVWTPKHRSNSNHPNHRHSSSSSSSFSSNDSLPPALIARFQHAWDEATSLQQQQHHPLLQAQPLPLPQREMDVDVNMDIDDHDDDDGMGWKLLVRHSATSAVHYRYVHDHPQPLSEENAASHHHPPPDDSSRAQTRRRRQRQPPRPLLILQIRMQLHLPICIKHVFEVLTDGTRRSQVEGPNIRVMPPSHPHPPLLLLNPYTWLEQYAYRQEWPAQDPPLIVSMASQWQILYRQQQMQPMQSETPSPQSPSSQQPLEEENEGNVGIGWVSVAWDEEEEEEERGPVASTAAAEPTGSNSTSNSNSNTEINNSRGRTKTSRRRGVGKETRLKHDWTLLRPVRIKEDRDPHHSSHTHMTRILSFQLLPQRQRPLQCGFETVARFLLEHYAHDVPLHMLRYFSAYEPFPEPRHVGAFVPADILIQDILACRDVTRQRAAERWRRFHNHIQHHHSSPSNKIQRVLAAQPIIIPAHDGNTHNDDNNNNNHTRSDKQQHPVLFLVPPLDQQAMWLMMPLLVYALARLVEMECGRWFLSWCGWSSPRSSSSSSSIPPPESGMLLIMAFFFMTLYVSIRQVVLLHLGPAAAMTPPEAIATTTTETQEQQHSGGSSSSSCWKDASITFRFEVDLKGAMRFMTNKKEERMMELYQRRNNNDINDENDGDDGGGGTGRADVEILHIVACAVVTAFQKQQQVRLRQRKRRLRRQLRRRRLGEQEERSATEVRLISIPWLCIHRYVSCHCEKRRPSNHDDDETVSVTFLTDEVSTANNHGETGVVQVVTLSNVSNRSVQQIADDYKTITQSKDNYRLNAANSALGSCLIVSLSSSNNGNFEASVVPSTHSNVQVVCAVGEIKWKSPSPSPAWKKDVVLIPTRRGGTLTGRGEVDPRPHLPLLLTMVNQTEDTSGVKAAKQLAEEIQTLLRFPEMCDD